MVLTEILEKIAIIVLDQNVPFAVVLDQLLLPVKHVLEWPDEHCILILSDDLLLVVFQIIDFLEILDSLYFSETINKSLDSDPFICRFVVFYFDFSDYSYRLEHISNII